MLLIVYAIVTQALHWKSNIPITSISVDLISNPDLFYDWGNETIPAVLASGESFCDPEICRVNANDQLPMDISFPIFIIALMGFLGWFLFSIYAGIGMMALPMDLINAWVERPQYMNASKYATMRQQLDKRLAELIEIGETIAEEIEETYVTV